MNIDELSLSDQEKSVMLAWLMGWSITKLPVGHDDLFFQVPERYDTFEQDFYIERNMALAWRVLNWANENVPFGDGADLWREWEGWWDGLDIKGERPAEAQRAWLDKTLELAIKAGLVEGATT